MLQQVIIFRINMHMHIHFLPSLDTPLLFLFTMRYATFPLHLSRNSLQNHQLSNEKITYFYLSLLSKKVIGSGSRRACMQVGLNISVWYSTRVEYFKQSTIWNSLKNILILQPIFYKHSRHTQILFNNFLCFAQYNYFCMSQIDIKTKTYFVSQSLYRLEAYIYKRFFITNIIDFLP